MTIVVNGILYRNQLHYVSDEIYMNSIHGETAEFISALSIDKWAIEMYRYVIQLFYTAYLILMLYMCYGDSVRLVHTMHLLFSLGLDYLYFVWAVIPI